MSILRYTVNMNVKHWLSHHYHLCHRNDVYPGMISSYCDPYGLQDFLITFVYDHWTAPRRNDQNIGMHYAEYHKNFNNIRTQVHYTNERAQKIHHEFK